MQSERKIVAVLPAFNLESSIGAIVKRTQLFVDNVVVVADGSRDNTATVAHAAGAIVPQSEQVRGKGFAIIKGIQESKKLGAGIVILMDSDGQHLPEEIPVMIKPLLEGRADLVSGSRMLGTLRTSRINKFGNWGLKIISFLVTWKWLTDTETGYRAFLSEKLYDIPLYSRGYEIESELILRSLYRKLRIVEVPITVPFAVPGVTVWDGFKVGWYKVKMGVRLRLGLEEA